MSTAKQTPLGVNVAAGQLQNLGFYINPVAAGFMGSSRVNDEYNFGSLINETYLKPLVWAINDAYKRSIAVGSQVGTATDCTIDGDVLTIPVTSTVTGSILVGSTITGSGVYSGTKIVKQVTGDIGESGTYIVDTFQYIKTGITITAKNIQVEWHTITNTAWGSFMNANAIWSGNDTAITSRSYSALVSFPKQGTYTFTIAGDNYLIVTIDNDTPIYIGLPGFKDGEEKEVSLNVKNGIHLISMIIINAGGPAGGAIRIDDSNGTELWNTRDYIPVTEYNGPTVSNVNYDALISIGQDVMPVLGNSLPDSYLPYDPSHKWLGQANTGYFLTEDPCPAQGQSQSAKWSPYNTTNINNSVTQWGYYRLHALQAWNEFNWNGDPLATGMPQYKDFTSSFLSADTFVNFVNEGINSFVQAPEFLKGTYSNMNDLISSDITGVSLATRQFGSDCIALGRAIDLTKLQTFGLPSVLLQTIKTNKILTQSLSFALLSAGLSPSEVNEIAAGNVNPVPKLKEQQIYGAFLIIAGRDLEEILFALNCKTQGLETLADLLNIKKLFPTSYQTLTVPIYNATPGPTNSKTYYPIYTQESVSVRIQAPEVVAQVGEQIPPGPPPIVESLPLPLSPTVSPPVPPVETPVGGGGCVALESYIPYVESVRTHNGRPITQAWMLEQNMSISLGTEQLEIVNGKVVSTLNDLQPCVRILTREGIALVCSTTAPIFTKEDGFVKAPDLLGKHVAVMRDNKTWFDEIVNVTDVGTRFVRVIDTGDNSFWAGENPDAFILHHNIFINQEIDRIQKN